MLLKGLIYLSMVGLLVVASCGKEDDDEAEKAELEGTWAYPCELEDEDENGGSNLLAEDDEDPSYEQQSMIFSGDNFEYRTSMSDEADCSNAYLRMGYVGTYQTHGESEDDSGAKLWDFTVSKIVVTPLGDGAVEYLNSQSECGKTDWAVNTETDISDLTCSDLGGDTPETVPFTHYDIYQRTDNTLKMGSGDGDSSGSSEATRPTTFEDRVATRS